MRLPSDDREFAEIFVDSYQDPRFLMGLTEDLVVARILRPVTRPHDIVPAVLEGVAHAFRHASVEKDPQAALPPSAGSTRSCPTSRRA